MTGADSWIAVEIRGLMIDPTSNLPIVILGDPEKKRYLPIWIGVFEAQAIAMKLEGQEAPRPMSHDLMASLLEAAAVAVGRVVITDLRDNTFYAEIHLETKAPAATPPPIDARPSDAIALALRVGAPLFVAEEVFEQAQNRPTAQIQDAKEQIRKWLEEASPEEFGKYEM